MRSASSDPSRPSRSHRLGLLAAGVAVALALLAGEGSAPATGRVPLDPVLAHRIADGALGAREERKLRTLAWQGGSYTTSTGESVRVLVSESYADAYAVGQRWADFFASLLHGSELGLVTAYVVTPGEMEELCGPYALGCYGGNQLAFIGETVHGVTSHSAPGSWRFGIPSLASIEPDCVDGPSLSGGPSTC
jgi:hypothetical protein